MIKSSESFGLPLNLIRNSYQKSINSQVQLEKMFIFVSLFQSKCLIHFRTWEDFDIID